MIKKLLLAYVFSATLFSAAQAETIFSDNFNSNTANTFGGTPAGWNVSSGTLDIVGVGNSVCCDYYPGNGSYLDLDGSNVALGPDTFLYWTTPFTLAAGSYTLSFDYGINFLDSLGDTDFMTAGAFVDGVGVVFQTTPFDAGELSHSSPAFLHFSQTFVLANSVPSALFFISGINNTNGDLSGGIIDNFEVTSNVPVPGAALLLMSGLACLSGLKRMYRKA